MAKKTKKKYSRLGPAYLASRHAGPLFMFLALGLLCGMIYRTLVQPTRYHARAEAAVRVVPAEAASAFNWDAKELEWREILNNRRDRGLLSANLRHAVKLAVTQDAWLDTDNFDVRLADYDPRDVFSASLFHDSVLARLGPQITVTRRDLAAFMDFQSLAAVVADLDPPREGSEKWDFSFFNAAAAEAAGNGIVVRPGPDDHFFKVFYRLHEQLKGQTPDSPFTAWRTAVDELAHRLDGEAAYAGGGGFGPIAKREILREMASIPVLAANGLYHVNNWFTNDAGGDSRTASWDNAWGRDTVLTLRHRSGNEGVLSAGTSASLKPLFYRRDTVYTRLPPLAAATLMSFVTARESVGEPVTLATETAVAIVPEEDSQADYVAELEPLDNAETVEASEIAYQEVIDDVAAKQRLSLIGMHEEAVNMARLERDAAVRRLNAARDADNRLSHEALAARARADRLQERYDAAVLAAEPDNQPKVPPETARLFVQRDQIFARLNTLLQYCTEEHPFVRQARRELEALEIQLAGHSPDAEANRAAEARATRIANLYLEWETAGDQADTLGERSRRQNEAVTCLLDEVTDLERCISQRELELAQAKESPIPIIRREIPAVRKQVAATPAPKPVPAPVPVARPAPAVLQARLEVGPPPSRIPLEKFPPDWSALLCGLLGGLCLGIVWALLRELFGSRFRNAFEARCMVGLPVLAALPAYDSRSFRAAAATMKGETIRGGGMYQFVPAPVEQVEPPAEARRGKILPAAGRPRFLAWVFGLLFLLLAGLLYYKSLTGFAQPFSYGMEELALPDAAVRSWAEEREQWGDLP